MCGFLRNFAIKRIYSVWSPSADSIFVSFYTEPVIISSKSGNLLQRSFVIKFSTMILVSWITMSRNYTVEGTRVVFKKKLVRASSERISNFKPFQDISGLFIFSFEPASRTIPETFHRNRYPEQSGADISAVEVAV